MKSQVYIRNYGNVAVDSVRNTKLFPSVVLAQAALESGWGQSSLAFEHHNHFGIKANKAWTGKFVLMPTREVIKGEERVVNAKFRKYDTSLDSFKDRNQFLAENQRYQAAGVFDAKTPEAQVIALQKAGYATDPNYANAIIKLIRTHNLYQLDELAKKKGFIEA